MTLASLWRRTATLGGAVLVTASLLGTDLAQAQSKADLLYRLQALDAEIADIRARLGGATGGAPVAGAGGGAIEDELRRLTARLEQIERAQRDLRADLGRRLGDIEYRLNELEGVPNDGTTRPLAGDLSTPTDTTTTSDTPAASVSERNRLDAAIKDIEQGRYDQAEDRLRRFMREYPDTPLIGEAHYWMAQSLSTRGLYAEAAKSYLAGYNASRRGAFGGENLLGVGVALGKLGQVREACLTLFEVKAQFPGPGGVAAKADQVADELSCS